VATVGVKGLTLSTPGRFNSSNNVEQYCMALTRLDRSRISGDLIETLNFKIFNDVYKIQPEKIFSLIQLE